MAEEEAEFSFVIASYLNFPPPNIKRTFSSRRKLTRLDFPLHKNTTWKLKFTPSSHTNVAPSTKNEKARRCERKERIGKNLINWSILFCIVFSFGTFDTHVVGGLEGEIRANFWCFVTLFGVNGRDATKAIIELKIGKIISRTCGRWDEKKII